ncbi:PPR domain-containing protein/PPR_2 domain-containing protein [Cephalotus follicularis]|uniref:PPR domain-containing protein/PPR_2 domain-containing protein n=1 Tax=Cephalotus follicularis TaxID=3775 RepID=A0A1Q3CGT5_CEPFO|nr:PPR domain-containing protein/PPR_2 domain-containing protein [Cephalotus follicularis]
MRETENPVKKQIFMIVCHLRIHKKTEVTSNDLLTFVFILMSSLKSIAKHPIISLIKSCTTLKELKQIHTHLLTTGTIKDPHFVGQFVASIALNNPINLNYSEQVLERCDTPTLFTLNSMIRAHCKSCNPQKSFYFYIKILHSDLVCQTALVGALAKCGDIVSARKMFDEMPDRDPIAWNTMIAGYAQCGRSREALRLFHLMQLEGVKVDEVSMVSVLSACAHLGALDQGRWAHYCIERNKFPVTVALGTALIDMYAKCGDMNKAMEVFWGTKDRNVYTWSSAMNGLAINGAGEECLELFSLMKWVGVIPNEITFVSVLRGCSLVGLVDEGCHHFDSMRKVYGIEPQLEHYGCMVDLYGRAGLLEKALSFINSMPMKPHAGAWGALLNACKTYKNMGLGELASQKIVELEAENHGAYVLLSNIYADSKDWDGVINVREIMKAKGVRKLPGCTVIEVDGEVHEFIVGDRSHPRYGEIEVMLVEISRRLKLAGYVANTNPVLFDI